MSTVKSKPTIGWIGTGVMGVSMCKHVMPLASRTVVYNRTKAKAQPLLDAGALWAENAAEVARQSDLIFTIVGYPQDVEETYFGPAGIFKEIKEGAIVVDMSTTKPSQALRIYAEAQKHGVGALDAPVSGGDVGARLGKLSIMVGGEEASFEAVRPYFETMGTSIKLQGGPGSGQHTKMTNQIVIAGTMIGVCEALVYGKRANLDLEKMIATISKGAAGCWSLDNLAPRILQDNYDPGFYIDYFVKDMGIALEEAAAMQIFMPGLALVRQLYITMQAVGEGKLGTQGLIRALERIA